MIVFKGYSGLRGFLTGTRYGIDNLKVGIIASASSVYAAATSGANMIVFKGYSGLRGFLTGTRYGIDNLKVGIIASASSVYAAATSVGLGTAAKTTVSTAGKSLGGLGFGIVAAFEIAEWLTSDDPFNNWSDLWMGLGSSAIKAVIATAMGLMAGAFAITFGIPAIAIVGIGAGIVIGVSFGLEITDRHFGITDKAKNYSNKLGL